LCPPGSTTGTASGGDDTSGGGGDTGDDDSTTTSTTTTTTLASMEIPGMANAIAEDLFPTTMTWATDMNELASMLASERSSQSKNLPASTTAQTTGTGTATKSTTKTAASTTTTVITTTGLGCYTYSDPDSGLDGTYCQCPGYDGILPTLTGTASACLYTSLPTITTTNPTTTDAPGSYPYTFTDLYGVIVACASESSLHIAGYSLTECAGSSTTLKAVTRTVTKTVTTSALSKYCMGGHGYFECVHELDLVGQTLCPKRPRALYSCMRGVIENSQEECESLCTFTTGTTVTTYTTLAP
jgi:hypothetical protein